jgi:hypothetical protein
LDEHEQNLQTARDIASTDFVNLQAGAEYLAGCHPDLYPTAGDAAKAIAPAAPAGDIVGGPGAPDDTGPASEDQPI